VVALNQILPEGRAVREGLECSVDVTGVANVDQTDKPYKV